MGWLKKLSGRRAGYDEFGNPEGEMFDLGGGDEERLRGERILFYVPGPNWYDHEWHHAQNAVRQRNLQMDIRYPKRKGKCSLDAGSLDGYSQLWFVSSEHVTLNNNQVKMIDDFVRRGNGLLIWADNDPYFADANVLARKLVGTEFSGNKPGNRVLVPGDELKPGYFLNHALTQGINNLYEGRTISTIAPAPGLTILAQSHDGQYCMAYFEQGSRRIVLDTGFTKLLKGRFHKTAGTARYFKNIAFWLARGSRDYQYKQFTPGRESLATINPNSVSERYVYNVAQPTSLTYILHWQGQGTLGILIQDPRGQVIQDAASSEAPIRLEIPATVTGLWSCWVKGVHVPHADFPYVLTLAVKTGGGTAPQPAVTPQARPAPMVTPPATKRLPIYLLIDASAGASDVVPALERPIRLLADQLRARPPRGAQPALSILVAGGADQVAVPLTEISRFAPPDLTARGGMMLGHALRGLLQSLTQDRLPADSKPLIVILLGNPPADDWATEADQLRHLVEQKRANVFAVTLGDFTDTSLLSRLSPVGPLALKSVSPAEVEQFFDWIYQVANAMLAGLEQGTEGRSMGVPPMPACVTAIQ